MTGLQPFTRTYRVRKATKNAEHALIYHSFNSLAANFPVCNLSLPLGFAVRARCSRIAEVEMTCPESRRISERSLDNIQPALME